MSVSYYRLFYLYLASSEPDSLLYYLYFASSEFDFLLYDLFFYLTAAVLYLGLFYLYWPLLGPDCLFEYSDLYWLPAGPDFLLYFYLCLPLLGPELVLPDLDLCFYLHLNSHLLTLQHLIPHQYLPYLQEDVLAYSQGHNMASVLRHLPDILPLCS